jgi:hypothetical protein
MTKKHRNRFEADKGEDTDTHDLLVQTYLKYFKENENFEKRCSWRTRWATRQLLQEIIILAQRRRSEIIKQHNAKLKELDPEKYQIRKEKNIETLSTIKKDSDDGEQKQNQG